MCVAGLDANEGLERPANAVSVQRPFRLDKNFYYTNATDDNVMNFKVSFNTDSTKIGINVAPLLFFLLSLVDCGAMIWPKAGNFV